MKKSLEQAKHEAKELSIKHKDTVFYVMDKKGKQAECYSLSWCVKERMLEGYRTVTRFLNGADIGRY